MKPFSRSTLIAACIAAAAALWMLSGMIGGGDGNNGASRASTPAARNSAPTMAVSVVESRQRPLTLQVSLSGRTEPNRIVEVAAETDGRIASIGAERGEPVEQGQVIASIAMQDRQAQVREAEALVRQRELESAAAQRLRGRDFMSEAQIAQAEAQLESARAALERVRLDIANTEVTAPFDGVIDDREVELGDYVGVGDLVATLVDVDPLVVSGDISEREIYELDIGIRGTARLLSGEEVEGELRYVSPVANEATRTFRVELAIPNPGGALRAGMSAEVLLPGGEIMAHHLSPALLTLNDQGAVGVKTVNARNKVEFHTVEVVASGADGIWVTGLPPSARIITVGQGFVAAGEAVNPVPAEQALQIDEQAGETGGSRP